MILRRGRVVESGTTAKVFGNPVHPYTRALLDAVPDCASRWGQGDGSSRPEIVRSMDAAGPLTEVEPDHLVALDEPTELAGVVRAGRKERTSVTETSTPHDHLAGAAGAPIPWEDRPAGHGHACGARRGTRSSAATSCRGRTASSTRPSSPSATVSRGSSGSTTARSDERARRAQRGTAITWEIDERADHLRGGRRPGLGDPGAPSSTPTTRGSPGSRIATT